MQISNRIINVKSLYPFFTGILFKNKFKFIPDYDTKINLAKNFSGPIKKIVPVE